MMKETPQNWSVRPLSEVVDILDRKRIPVNAKERQQREGGIPYYGATGQVGWIDDYLFDEELVLLGEDGAPFLDFRKQKAYIVRGKSWVNNHAHVLRSLNGLPNSYIKYYLDTVDYRPFVTGTTRLKLNQAAMKKIPIPIAPGNYPRRIVEEIEKQLSRLGESVVNLKRVKANLKRYKASVLQDAVTGKLTEEWRKQNPDVEPARKLLERILIERRQKWEETELAKMRAKGKEPNNDKWKEKYKAPLAPDISTLPDLPDQWMWTSTEQISNVTGGLTQNKKRDQYAAKMPFLRVANVYANELRLDEVLEIGVLDSELGRVLLKKGDLLVVEGNGSPDQIGRLAIWDASVAPCVHQNHLIKVRLLMPEMGKLVLYWLLSLQGRQCIKAVANSTTGLYTLSISKVSHLPSPLAPLREQQVIIQEVESRLSVAAEIERTIDVNLKRAERMRQSILKQAFSGKLCECIL